MVKNTKKNKKLKRNIKKEKERKKTQRVFNGGKAINSGSYGCIFKPALKCKNNQSLKNTNKKNLISKLMDNEDAIIEYENILNVQSHIKQIPNNDDYFLVNDITMCVPDKLSNSDLYMVDNVCDIVKYNGYDKTNINNNINNFKIINMPYGGITLNKLWEQMVMIEDIEDIENRFIKVNMLLIKLLENGIIPLNKSGMYHMDIKDENIIISDDIKYARLIDWGLSQKINNNIIPSRFIQEFQFNLPFTNILFNLNIINLIKQSLNNEKIKKKSLLNMKMIVKNIITKLKYNGHYMSILYYIIIIYYPNKVNKFNNPEYIKFAVDIMCNYIATAIIHYTDVSGEFQLIKYCREVYLHNVDVWGFIISYLYSIIYTIELPIYKAKFIKSVSDIIINYCFNSKYAISPIPVDKVINDLRKITIR